jgi:hypothetical protein
MKNARLFGRAFLFAESEAVEWRKREDGGQKAED